MNLSFNGVEYLYPSSAQAVLKDVSFDVDAGWMGVVGENGAGKTTLLNMLGGM